MGIASILFLIFLVLKLTAVGAVATWSWWAVTSPLWIALGLWLMFFIAVVIPAGIATRSLRKRGF